jgi:hypothetical protein
LSSTWKSPNGTIEASVVVAGTQLPFHCRNDGRPFAAGVPGSAYTVLVRNLTGVRAEVILTVDGRNTAKDEPGDARANSGLVIPAGYSHEFTGWRLDDTAVREFLFGDPSASVAAMATGSDAHTGVIGIAVHRERLARVSYGYTDPGYTRVAASSSILRGAPARGDSKGMLGTGIGERVSSPVGRTEFTRDGNAPDILVIGYDTQESLRERGIISPPDPDAFPGQPTGYEKYSAP